MTAEGQWRRVRYADLMEESDERAGDRTDLPVLSVTKSRGPMLASERFGKAMHGRELSRYRVARRGQIVADPMLLWDGAIGAQTVVEAGLVSPDYRVYGSTNDIDPEFLAYLVRGPTVLPHYQGGARGTNVRRNRIARSDFLSIPVDLPPLGAQQKIAAILSSVDKAIDATDTVIAELRNVRKAMMAELLTKGVPGRATGQGWVERRLDEVAHVQTGIAKGKAVENGVTLPYLRVANVQDGYVDLAELKTIVVEANAIERFALRPGDVLFTEGGDADKLGRGCVWEGQITPCLHQNHVFAVRPDRRVLMPKFLAYAAASPRGKDYFLGCAKQTTNLASINSSQLRAFPVPLAPIDEQSTIVESLSAVDDRLAAERITAQEVRSVKRALMSALLTGNLRVHPDSSGEAAA